MTHSYSVANSAYDFPYAVGHDCLDADQIALLGDICSRLPMDDGAVQKRPEESKSGSRVSRIGWIHPSPETMWVFGQISSYLESLNEQFFRVELYGFDVIQYTEYSESYGGKYDWHTDVTYGTANTRPGLHRKLSITIPLNDDYEGGEFHITTSSEDTEVIFPELRKGSMLLFPSYMVHRVTPVTRGTRKSLVVWVVGPKFR